MRPVSVQFDISQAFGSMPTNGVAASDTPNTVGWYVKLYGNYQPFGHAGGDIACPVGTPVYAMKPGKVVWADWGHKLPGDDSEAGWRSRWYFYKGMPGILTVIHHPEIGPHVYSAYAHLSSNDAAPVGTQVKEGQLIGYSGDTGGVAAHLHVERLVDPNYSTGNGLIYGRADPSVWFTALTPTSTTPKEPFTVTQMDTLQEYHATTHAKQNAQAKAFEAFVKQNREFHSTTHAKQNATREVVDQIAANLSKIAAGQKFEIDWTKVEAAAEKGAAEALRVELPEALASNVIKVDVTVAGQEEAK